MAPKKKLDSKPVPQPPADLATLEAEVATVVAATKPKRRWTIAETNEQLQFVLDWRIDGFDRRGIMRGLRSKWPDFTNKRLDDLWDRVERILVQRSESSLVARKESALSRLRRDAAVARLGEWDAARKAWKHKPDLKTALHIERLISEIEGTQAPVQVNVNQQLTAAMVSVVARLSGEDAADYLAEALEQKRLADCARRLLPAIDVEAVETDTPGSVHAAE